ncbi:MAG: nucleotidyltransferase domain-containing protein [Chloroflexota bacterium]|nr:nucleotidyltransferase domain-containing protein [Chloroflexota bacterium]
MPVVAAAIVGSVARGDFNVWSDIDVVVITEELPERAVEREGLLLDPAALGVQPVGYTRVEFDRALAKGDRIAREAVTAGVPLVGAAFFAERRSLTSSA